MNRNLIEPGLDGIFRLARREEQAWHRHGDDEQRRYLRKRLEVIQGIYGSPREGQLEALG